jgi:hypothetical protein
MSRPVEVSDVEFNGDAGTSFLRTGLWKRNVPKAGFPKQEKPMTKKIKTLSAIAILAAAVATPVFAQSTHHSRAYDRYRRAYNQFNGPSYATPRTDGGRNMENFQFNRSFPGGEDPSDHPSGS